MNRIKLTQDIYNDFKLKKPFGIHGSYKKKFSLERVNHDLAIIPHVQFIYLMLTQVQLVLNKHMIIRLETVAWPLVQLL